MYHLTQLWANEFKKCFNWSMKNAFIMQIISVYLEAVKAKETHRPCQAPYPLERVGCTCLSIQCPQEPAWTREKTNSCSWLLPIRNSFQILLCILSKKSWKSVFLQEVILPHITTGNDFNIFYLPSIPNSLCVCSPPESSSW